MRRTLPVVLAVGLALTAEADQAPGWSEGQPAAGTAETLAPAPAFGVALPPEVSRHITGPTILFYYSPTCPHCQEVMPEIRRLAGYSDLPVLGIAAGATSQALVDEFARVYGATFPTVIDASREFALAVGARATPNVYVAAPNPIGSEKPFSILQSYTPFARGMGPLLRMRAHPDAPFADFRGFQGDSVCNSCHQQEAMSWAITHHAQAYYTLYERNRAEDLKCVGCHVTGMGQEGGFTVGDHRSPLTSVTCEACHGASGPHDGEPSDASASCEGCHDAEHSVAFSLAKGLPLIDHYAANAMSAEDLRSRIDAIAAGDAPRPLLAFPTGDTVGAAACATCHKATHKAWKKDPHADAMDQLHGAEASDASCVRCHATERQMGAGGPPAESVAGYRTDEGVGCESCHGPAGAHVADPRKDNIVGLGESCPECVIEAICTSCHTPRWDPGWELKKRLQAIDH